MAAALEGTSRSEGAGPAGAGLLLDRMAPPAALRRVGERLERVRNNDALRAALTACSLHPPLHMLLQTII